ncbi:uncharacterized protein LOC120423561 [Culex pipiens pallens]|uniref:uncharacterized protein LOC120423561 n=1 Tax=Culex pipiens pallens TaxID=42434 RepID=UPI00195300EC|nr:uncharacterized protein LOC120423561 [Culex pipiens pallens]
MIIFNNIHSDAAKLLSEEDSVKSSGKTTRNLGSFLDLNLSVGSGTSRPSFTGGRSFAEVSRSSTSSGRSRLSRNGIFYSASTEPQPPNLSSDLDFPILTVKKSSSKIRPTARTPRKTLVELNGPRRHPQGTESKVGAENLVSGTQGVQVKLANRWSSASVDHLHTNGGSDSGLPLTVVKSSNKIRPPARTPRKPLVELNGSRCHPQGTDAKTGDHWMPSERPTSVLPYLENSEKEATPTSSPLKERNETKHQKQKEDSGNLTVLDITFGDFNAPITSTPKPRIPYLLRDSVDSQREEIENFPAVSVDEMDDSSLKPSIADRWSFAGWAGHDPRPDVQSLTVCIPMEGPAGAFPGAIDLSVQTRSGKELLDRPVPAPAGMQI